MDPVSQPAEHESLTASAPPRLVIVTGLSGAGRRTAAHALEDLGWYVVDNVPAEMVPSLVELAANNGQHRVAVVLDVRSVAMTDQMPHLFDRLAEQGIDTEMLFLEATDQVIVQRQESSRRPLPLQGDGTMLDGIATERRLLANLRAMADMVVDTTNITGHQLGNRVAHAYGGERGNQLRLALMSFGFKRGVPIDADLIFDARFLPNPHWVPELRALTGLSEPVSDYVLGQPGAMEFLDRIDDLIALMTPGYLHEGKRQVTIGIGCTGGKHRSTALSQALVDRLRGRGLPATILHRDLGLE